MGPGDRLKDPSPGPFLSEGVVMRVVAFARAGHEVSVAEQLLRVEQWALDEGHAVVRLPRPGPRDWSSPGICNTIEACRGGAVDVVGVTDLSRLGTCRGVLAAVMMLLEHARVRVAVVRETCTDLYTPGAPELWTSDAMAEATHRLLFEERVAEGSVLPVRRRASVLPLIGRGMAGRRTTTPDARRGTYGSSRKF